MSNNYTCTGCKRYALPDKQATYSFQTVERWYALNFRRDPWFNNCTHSAHRVLLNLIQYAIDPPIDPDEEDFQLWLDSIFGDEKEMQKDWEAEAFKSGTPVDSLGQPVDKPKTPTVCMHKRSDFPLRNNKNQLRHFCIKCGADLDNFKP